MTAWSYFCGQYSPRLMVLKDEPRVRMDMYFRKVSRSFALSWHLFPRFEQISEICTSRRRGRRNVTPDGFIMRRRKLAVCERLSLKVKSLERCDESYSYMDSAQRVTNTRGRRKLFIKATEGEREVCSPLSYIQFDLLPERLHESFHHNSPPHPHTAVSGRLYNKSTGRRITVISYHLLHQQVILIDSQIYSEERQHYIIMSEFLDTYMEVSFSRGRLWNKALTFRRVNQRNYLTNKCHKSNERVNSRLSDPADYSNWPINLLVSRWLRKEHFNVWKKKQPIYFQLGVNGSIGHNWFKVLPPLPDKILQTPTQLFPQLLHNISTCMGFYRTL